jgi:hypothetical protein
MTIPGKPNGLCRTHKVSGWTRSHVRDGGQRWTITPTDASGERIVEFLSAGSWSNNPADDDAQREDDRVVLISGEALPAWAVAWLTNACRTQCERGRDALRAALEDADRHNSMGDGW